MTESTELERRSSGVLLHPTSLPGPSGIGDLGASAYRFADLLAAAGQTWWQMLPIGPTLGDGCPYVSTSAIAANPLLISLERLCDEGLLDPSDLDDGPRGARIDFDQVRAFKMPRLRKAYARLGSRPDLAGALLAFTDEHAAWLDDFALFSAIREAHQRAPWTAWPADLRSRSSAALDGARHDLADEIGFHRFCELTFDRQWSALRAHTSRLGLRLMGDLPIFVAPDSADVWSRPELFKLDPEGRPTVVAGVPPDYFSETGQLWGNPLYRWDVLRASGFGWWIDRLKGLLRRFDAVRIDHFIGFHRSWQIPAGSKDARIGQFEIAPGQELFSAVRSALGPLPIVAEDLGLVTPEVHALRDEFKMPGMKVLQFAFGPDEGETDHQPHTYKNRAIVYTGTHDNETTVGWWNELGQRAEAGHDDAKKTRAFVLRYLGADGRQIHWDLIRGAMASVANLAIVPLQDLLGLDGSARMNLPGTTHPRNWTWRYDEGAIGEPVLGRLLELTRTYARDRGRHH